MKRLSFNAKPPVPPVPGPNSLLEIHDSFSNFFVKFREKVCEECAWSVPTYYRKMRGAEKDISNAERAKIKQVERDCIRELMKRAGMLPADLPGEAA